jgi:hypothetical protein
MIDITAPARKVEHAAEMLARAERAQRGRYRRSGAEFGRT